MLKQTLAAAVLLATFGAPAAFADDDNRYCGNVSIDQWMDAGKMRSHAEGLGITVREIDIDDGCYKVEGTRGGMKVEIGFHPVSGKQVWVDDND